MDSFYYVALVTGLVTSLHCIGMCGPIAVALPLGKKSWPHRLAGSLTYNLGRTITYAILGAIFGLVTEVIGGISLGASVSFLQANIKTERDRIKHIFFMR